MYVLIYQRYLSWNFLRSGVGFNLPGRKGMKKSVRVFLCNQICLLIFDICLLKLIGTESFTISAAVLHCILFVLHL
jgi:hypothetical protein